MRKAASPSRRGPAVVTLASGAPPAKRRHYARNRRFAGVREKYCYFVLFLYILCSQPRTRREDMMARWHFFSEFSSLLLCFAAAYVWLLVG
jgi:hypothetical protein